MTIIVAAMGQDVSQIVQGTVIDAVAGQPLQGANVMVKAGTPNGTTTDGAGKFELKGVAPGRYRFEVSFTGYTTYTDELLVIAGKENHLSISLNPSTELLQEVVVGAGGEVPYVPGLESVSIEKTMRIPANFFDPVRMLTSYPGVVAANDQANAIIVKGNSPNGLLWRLNGVDIVNPNHLANAGTFSDKPMANGGGVNILSAQMLDRTNFYSGAFPARYGNALSGVLDMNLRSGNPNKTEFTAQASLIGLDVSAEGPISKKRKSSFLANYRYSTVGLLSQLGVQFGDEDITFQDISFNAEVELNKGSNLSLYGFFGTSSNDFEAKPVDEWEEDKDQYDINYGGDTYAVGLNYQTPAGPGLLFVGMAFSSSVQQRNAVASADDPFGFKLTHDLYDASKSLFSASIRYELPVGTRSRWETGIITNLQADDLDYRNTVGCLACAFQIDRAVNGTSKSTLFQPYTTFSASLSEKLSADVGARYVYYTYTASGVVEPRAMLTYQGASSSMSASYSLVSQTQLPQVYFATGNIGLSLTRAHHAELSHRKHWDGGLTLTSVLFYQALFDVPIEADPLSTFSTINLLEGVVPANLVNDGRGKNLGLTVNVEKSFFENHYFMLGGSYYESTYQTSSDEEFDTRFNGKYTANVVYGKEWTNAGKNRTIGLNTRVLYLGGPRESPVDVAESQLQRMTVYDQTNPYSEKTKDYFRVDLRLSFRKNKPGYTRTFAVDIQNLLNTENEAYHYYDFVQDKVATKFQLGIIPVLVYRIDF